MSNQTQGDDQVTAREAGARSYDSEPAGARPSGPRVYDAPERSGGPSLAMIIGILVALLVVGYLIIQVLF